MKAIRTISPQLSDNANPEVPIKRRPAARIGAKSRRGFAGMDPAQHRQIASTGGKASHSSGRAHRWTSEEASAAGRKGGLISRRSTSVRTLDK